MPELGHQTGALLAPAQLTLRLRTSLSQILPTDRFVPAFSQRRLGIGFHYEWSLLKPESPSFTSRLSWGAPLDKNSKLTVELPQWPHTTCIPKDPCASEMELSRSRAWLFCCPSFYLTVKNVSFLHVNFYMILIRAILFHLCGLMNIQ